MILIAHTDQLARIQLRDALEKAGYPEIKEAINCQELLQAFLRSDQKVDLLITDVMLPMAQAQAFGEEVGPIKAGLATVRLLKDPKKMNLLTLPVIFYTIVANKSCQEEVEDLGAAIVLMGRPVEEVVRLVTEFLEQTKKVIQMIKVIVEISQKDFEKTISRLEGIGFQRDAAYIEELEDSFLIRGEVEEAQIEKLKSFKQVRGVWIDAKVVPI